MDGTSVGVIVVDRHAIFEVLAVEGLKHAVQRMADDIYKISQVQVPYKSGKLQETGLVEDKTMPGKISYRISYNTPYARRRHFESWVNFTTAGTKAFYLSDPGELIGGQAVGYLMAAAALIGGAI